MKGSRIFWRFLNITYAWTKPFGIQNDNIDTDISFDVNDFAHQLQLLDHFFHVVIGRQWVDVNSNMFNECTPGNDRELA